MATVPCAPCVTPVSVSVPRLGLLSLASTLMKTGVSSVVTAVMALATGDDVSVGISAPRQERSMDRIDRRKHRLSRIVGVKHRGPLSLGGRLSRHSVASARIMLNWI